MAPSCLRKIVGIFSSFSTPTCQPGELAVPWTNGLSLVGPVFGFQGVLQNQFLNWLGKGSFCLFLKLRGHGDRAAILCFQYRSLCDLKMERWWAAFPQHRDDRVHEGITSVPWSVRSKALPDVWGVLTPLCLRLRILKQGLPFSHSCWTAQWVNRHQVDAHALTYIKCSGHPSHEVLKIKRLIFTTEWMSSSLRCGRPWPERGCIHRLF